MLKFKIDLSNFNFINDLYEIMLENIIILIKDLEIIEGYDWSFVIVL